MASYRAASPSKQPKQITSFGPHNEVTVETAVILRRITSADQEAHRPATAEQLANRQKLLPRAVFSAGVARRQEEIAELHRTVFRPGGMQNVCKSKFSSGISLVHLGVNLDIPANDDGSTLSNEKKMSKARKSSQMGKAPLPKNSNSASKPATLEPLFDDYATAKEAAAAMNAMDNLPQAIRDQHAFLSHLRETAENRLRESADRLVRGTVQPVRSSDRLSSSQSLNDSRDDVEVCQKKLLDEWAQFLELCRNENGALPRLSSPHSGDALAADDPNAGERELFMAFMRSRGSLPPIRDPPPVDPDVPPPLPCAVGTAAMRSTAMDDMTPPSRSVSSATPVLLKRPMMMLDAREKCELVDRLTEEAYHRRHSPDAAATSPLSPDTAKAARSLAVDKLQAASRTAIQCAVDEHDKMSRLAQHRTMERQLHSGLRLSRRGNMDLYRAHQAQLHKTGLRTEASTKQPAPAVTASMRTIGENSEEDPQQQQAGLVAGPPAATHKIRPKGSASKSRPGSSPTTQSAPSSMTPRSGPSAELSVTGPVTELPTVSTHKAPIANRK